MVNIMNELVYIPKIRFNSQKKSASARPINGIVLENILVVVL